MFNFEHSWVVHCSILLRQHPQMSKHLHRLSLKGWGLRAVSIWMGGDPMLIPDYIAISVLIVLALWAGVGRFPFPNSPRDRATE